MNKKRVIVSIIILCIFAGLLGYLSSSNNAYANMQTKERWITLCDTLQNVIDNPKIKGKKIVHIDKPFELDDKYKSVEMLQAEAFANLKQVEKLIKKNKADYKLCYLTFDDGPYAKTDKFLKRLDKYNIQATFFTTSVNGKRCYDDKSKKTAPFYKKYLLYGHTIANHTYSHKIFHGIYKNKKNFINSIKKQERHVKKLTGYTTRIARFPGGSYTAGRLRTPIIKELYKNNYAWVDWSAETGDGGLIKSSKKQFKRFKKTMGDDIEVVLCHDYTNKTYKLLPKMIKYARKHNYIFAPLFPESSAVNHK